MSMGMSLGDSPPTLRRSSAAVRTATTTGTGITSSARAPHSLLQNTAGGGGGGLNSSSSSAGRVSGARASPRMAAPGAVILSDWEEEDDGDGTSVSVSAGGMSLSMSPPTRAPRKRPSLYANSSSSNNNSRPLLRGAAYTGIVDVDADEDEEEEGVVGVGGVGEQYKKLRRGSPVSVSDSPPTSTTGTGLLQPRGIAPPPRPPRYAHAGSLPRATSTTTASNTTTATAGAVAGSKARAAAAGRKVVDVDAEEGDESEFGDWEEMGHGFSISAGRHKKARRGSPTNSTTPALAAPASASMPRGRVPPPRPPRYTPALSMVPTPSQASVATAAPQSSAMTHIVMQAVEFERRLAASAQPLAPLSGVRPSTTPQATVGTQQQLYRMPYMASLGTTPHTTVGMQQQQQQNMQLYRPPAAQPQPQQAGPSQRQQTRPTSRRRARVTIRSSTGAAEDDDGMFGGLLPSGCLLYTSDAADD